MVVLGILVRTGRPLPGLPRFAVAAVHRTTSLTALGLLAVHVGTLFLDPYAQLRLVDLVVPFGGAYRPLWLGLGTLAADLVLVLVGSSLLRQHIGQRTWRALHWAAYLCWPLALGHAIGNGTDGTSEWMLVIAAGCVDCGGRGGRLADALVGRARQPQGTTCRPTSRCRAMRRPGSQTVTGHARPVAASGLSSTTGSVLGPLPRRRRGVAARGGDRLGPRGPRGRRVPDRTQAGGGGAAAGAGSSWRTGPRESRPAPRTAACS